MEKPAIEISNGSLRINGQLIQLDYPVNNALAIGNMVIACLDIPKGVEYNRNIVAIDENPKIIMEKSIMR